MRILVDGRVFSTTAHDRGMGQYTSHLLNTLVQAGEDVTVLIFEQSKVPVSAIVARGCGIAFAPFVPEQLTSDEAMHEHTHFLTKTMREGKFDVYIDATPFISPCRLELPVGATIAVAFDLIPLKHPDFYLVGEATRRGYANGLLRVSKAHGVIAISNTVRDEVVRYLAVLRDRIEVLYPGLPPEYLTAPIATERVQHRKRVVCVLGSHKSKNPHRAVGILSSLGAHWDVAINVPTVQQRHSLEQEVRFPKGATITAAINDAAKFRLQAEADLVAHLSIEEGFGIPLAEALSLGKKVLALDVPINRELIALGGSGSGDIAAMLLPPTTETVDAAQLETFMALPSDAGFSSRFRAAIVASWHAGGRALQALAHRCLIGAERSRQGIEFQTFSSLPGTACGVADYSMAYLRERGSNALFFSHGDFREVAARLPATRLYSSHDFAEASRATACPTVFNFAFSPALDRGVALMFEYAKQGDVAVIHERWCLEGLAHLFGLDSPPAKSARLVRLIERFGALPLRLVDHLSPVTRSKVAEYRSPEGRPARNDLTNIEDRIDYVPMSIDDRTGPHVARAARRLRSARGIPQDAILVGHFGIIQDDHKRLRDVVSAFLSIATSSGWRLNDRQLYFVLAGRVVDPSVMDWIASSFADAGRTDRLIRSNPHWETDFDAEIAACDLIVCFRVQLRGQMSHAYVRSLALGRPVVVNEASGWAYDELTTASDENAKDGLSSALRNLTDEPRQRRRRARATWENTHNTSTGLDLILDRHSGISFAAAH